MVKELVAEARSLDEAIERVFKIPLHGRSCILRQEGMTGRVAEEYDALGKELRSETYRKIAEDFKRRTGCYGFHHPKTGMHVGTIVDVGCGSGLLTFELAEQTNGTIVGIDVSSDMIALARENLAQKSAARLQEIREFQKRLHVFPQEEESDKKEGREAPQAIPSPYDRITFLEGSVYAMGERCRGHNHINYIVCRNALHRLHDPRRAIEQMYAVLAPGGKIYIRDLRRDADWQIIKERIGERRWQSKTLVKDYLGAMASMLTMQELEGILEKSGIRDYTISNGEYLASEAENARQQPGTMAEFERETEYVCIIRKE